MQDRPDAEAVKSLTAILDGPEDQRAALATEKALLARPVGSPPSLPLARYVWSRTSGKPDANSFTSAGAALNRWCVREIFAVLQSEDLSVSSLRDWMGDDSAVGVTRRVLQNPNFDEAARKRIGEEVVRLVEPSVLEPLAETLKTPGRLRSFLALRGRVHGPASNAGTLNAAVDASDAETFTALLTEFIEIWTDVAGVVDHIQFGLDSWRESVSDDSTAAALARLSLESGLPETTPTDTSRENLGAIALHALLVEFPLPSV